MKNSPKTKIRPIEMRIVGGLGNQLFCFFAGLDLAARLKLKLRLDLTDIYSKSQKHKVTLESLNLVKNLPTIRRKAYLVTYLINRFYSMKPRANIFRSDEIGFDSKFEEIDSSRRVEGYFQTYIYFDRVKNFIPNVELINPSNWFLKEKNLIQENQAIALHVRRGDYIKLKNLYGLLDSSYYLRAIKRLQSMKVDGRIWVFSDDIVEAKQLLEAVLPSNTHWVIAPETSDAAESLILMSHATANIIANSTFSWWGAALNYKNPPVIVPKKWFQNMEDPKKLYPPNWIQIESSWIN